MFKFYLKYRLSFWFILLLCLMLDTWFPPKITKISFSDEKLVQRKAIHAYTCMYAFHMWVFIPIPEVLWFLKRVQMERLVESSWRIPVRSKNQMEMRLRKYSKITVQKRWKILDLIQRNCFNTKRKSDISLLNAFWKK